MLLTSPTHNFISWKLKRPKQILYDFIESASKEIGLKESVEWFIHPKDSLTIGFLGCALRGPRREGAICLASDIYKEWPIPYVMWLLKHELRHLQLFPFRQHELYLWDIGYDPPKAFGFFREDIKEISGDVVLHRMFENMVMDLESMEKVNWQWMNWGIKLGLTVMFT